jgi:ketosteroid isomerase-like protein
MRRSLLIVTAALLAGLPAGAGGGGAAQAQQASDADTVRRANAAIYTALSARDPQGFEALLAREPIPSLILPTSRTPSTGRDTIRRDYEAVFARYPEFAISMAEPEIRSGSEGALVTGIETVRARQATGEAAGFSLLATNVFVRSAEGRWLLLHRHLSPVPR